MPIYDNYKQTRSPARGPQANPVVSGYLTTRSAPKYSLHGIIGAKLMSQPDSCRISFSDGVASCAGTSQLVGVFWLTS